MLYGEFCDTEYGKFVNCVTVNAINSYALNSYALNSWHAVWCCECWFQVVDSTFRFLFAVA